MGSLTIAIDGKVLYTRAIGYSQINGTEKKPLTAASRFRIGSITKMVNPDVLDRYVGVYSSPTRPRKLRYKRRLDAFLSTAGRVIRCPPRSDGRG